MCCYRKSSHFSNYHFTESIITNYFVIILRTSIYAVYAVVTFLGNID
jgi:hypothetical protein